MVGGLGSVKYPEICDCNYHENKTISDYVNIIHEENIVNKK